MSSESIDRRDMPHLKATLEMSTDAPDVLADAQDVGDEHSANWLVVTNLPVMCV